MYSKQLDSMSIRKAKKIKEARIELEKDLNPTNLTFKCQIKNGFAILKKDKLTISTDV